MLLERLAGKRRPFIEREGAAQRINQAEKACEVVRGAKGGDLYVLFNRITAEEERQAIVAS